MTPTERLVVDAIQFACAFAGLAASLWLTWRSARCYWALDDPTLQKVARAHLRTDMLVALSLVALGYMAIQSWLAHAVWATGASALWTMPYARLSATAMLLLAQALNARDRRRIGVA